MTNQTPVNFGKAISKAEAQQCMDGYATIFEAFSKEIFPLLDSQQTGAIAAAETFYKTNYNAFVFSKDLVTRFFDNAPTADAQYLMAILGAQPADDPSSNLKKNTPTIILVGVTMDTTTGKFTSLPLPLPASEHPPQLVQQSFPLDGSQIFFENV